MLVVQSLILATAVCGGRAFAQAAGPASGQNAPVQTVAGANGDQLQEVVVTAQFRNENAQQTPLAITAISAAALEQRNETNLAQVAASVPSVSLLPAEAAFGPSMTASIRGIGQYDFDPALEPGVGIYIDDVYYGSLTGSLLDLLDLDRVEVLRGPQGTLAGMNSIGGSIKLYSQKPTGDGASSLSVLYGSRNHVEARAGTDFALIPDNLFVRFSAVYNHQDGYENVYDFGCSNPSFTATAINPVTNIPNAAPATYSVTPGFLTHGGSCLLGHEGGTNYGASRMSVRWVASDRVEVNLVGDITQQDQENPATTLLLADLPVLPSNASYYSKVTLATTSGAVLPYNSTLVPAMLPSNPYTSYSSFSMPAAGTTPAYSGSDSSNLLSWGTSGTVDWKLTDTMSLKSITSLRAFTSTWFEDNDASPWPLGLGGEYLEHHQFSEELRFNGSVPQLVDYTVGGYYFRENTVYGTHQDLWYAAGPGGLDFVGDDPVLAHDKAVFLQTDWHLTTKLDLIAGVRYTKQDKDYTFVRENPEGGTGGSAALVGSLNGYTGTYSGSKTDYRADIDYHWTDDVLTYAQVSTGFKGGGVNPRPFFAFQAVGFNPETVTNYEGGIKSSWFGNTLRANVDGYFADYKNIQLALLSCDFLTPPGLPPGLPFALPFNAGNAHIKGAEIELEEHPFAGLELDASGSYLDFGYTSFAPYPTGITFGMTTPFTPKLQGSLGVQYHVPLGSWGTITPRVDANARSSIFTNAVNGPTNRIGGYTFYNARITLKPDHGNWEASLEALNFTDKFYWANIFDLTGAGGGSVSGTPSPPLEVALQLKRTF
jgi:iron complex outermembrane recepter protein